MSEFLNAVRAAADGSLNGVSDAVVFALIVVGGLLIVASLVALAISIYLSIRYVKYNRKQNSQDFKKATTEKSRVCRHSSSVSKENTRRTVTVLLLHTKLFIEKLRICVNRYDIVCLLSDASHMDANRNAQIYMTCISAC